MPAFTLLSGEAALLIRGHAGMSITALSPFFGETAGAAGALRPELSNDPAARRAAPLLAAPDVRVIHRIVTPGQALVSFVACWRRDGPAVAVVMPAGSGASKVDLLEGIPAYLAAWLPIAGSPHKEAVANLLPEPLPLAEFAGILHATDMYRRAKRLREASYDPDSVLQFSEQEFIDAAAAAARSSNAQFLLPAMLMTAPGLRDAWRPASRDDITALMRRGILAARSGSNGTSRDLAFGPSGEALGEAFASGVRGAAGLEVAVWTDGAARPVLRGSIVQGDRANHLIEVESSPTGQLMARHDACTYSQLASRLTSILLGPLAAPEVASSSTTAPTADASRPPAQAAAGPVCARCGFANPPGLKFCGGCGASLATTGPDLAGHDATRPAPARPDVADAADEPLIRPRSWFRAHAPARTFELKPGHVRSLAAVLRRIRDSNTVSEEAFKALHAALRVSGPGDTAWTVGLGSLQWAQLVNGKWTAAPDPAFCAIDGDALRALVTAAIVQQISERGGRA
jgi:hypothetical protein